MAGVAPDLIGPVTGIREFRLFGPRLGGKYSRWGWPLSEWAIAECNPECFDWPQHTLPFDHVAPHRACRCGIHVWYDRPLPPNGPKPMNVLGVVECKGVVIPHAYQMRVERARLLAVHDPFGREMTVEAAAHYGVPVVGEKALYELNDRQVPVSKRPGL